MHQVVWTEYAAKPYEETINYLVDNYSLDTAIKFDEKLNKQLDVLETFPNSCEKHPTKKHLRKCKITKQTSLITFTKGNTVELIMFTDNRMQDFKR